jgi:hypothetical protein
MTGRPTPERRVDADGVRVFEDGRARRDARVRRLVSMTAVAAAAIVVLSASAVRLLRPHNPDTRDGSVSGHEGVSATRPGLPLPAGQGDRASGVASPVPLAKPASGQRPSPGAGPARSAREEGAAAATATERAPDPTSPADQRDDSLLADLVRGAIDGLRAHGKPEGLAVFPPKGTNPPKAGLVVPDDYQLPEGYVRYYQITDEGQRLEPILMFSPDYAFMGPDGKPVALPADGIVPPEMAPPGLPLRTLVLPDGAAPATGRR